MLDPLAFIFIPGAAAMMLALASPLFVLRGVLWRRRADKLNAHARCGRCGERLPIESFFLYAGKYVCPSCADALRRRMTVLLPIAAGTAVLLAVSSASAFVISGLTDGPSLKWWLDWRWLPLILPSVGTAIATVTAVTAGRRANLLKNNVPRDLISAGFPVGQPVHAHDRDVVG